MEKKWEDGRVEGVVILKVFGVKIMKAENYRTEIMRVKVRGKNGDKINMMTKCVPLEPKYGWERFRKSC